jgi:hypothetical protein
MTLTADQRRALTLLANADGNGATQQLLAADGFARGRRGLATLTREKVLTSGDKAIEVGRFRITEARRPGPTHPLRWFHRPPSHSARCPALADWRA